MRAPSPGTVALLTSAAAYAEPWPVSRRGRRRKTEAELQAERERKAARKRQKSARRAGR